MLLTYLEIYFHIENTQTQLQNNTKLLTKLNTKLNTKHDTTHPSSITVVVVYSN